MSRAIDESVAELAPSGARSYRPSPCWLRFSLRSLFVFTLLLSIPLGWLGMKLANKRAERRLVETIEATGGRIAWMTDGDPFEDPRWSDPIRTRSNAIIQYFAGVDQLFDDTYALEIEWRPRQTSIDVDHAFRQMTTILAKTERVNLSSSDVGDVHLHQLSRLVNLKVLGLASTDTSDEGVKHIARLSKLETLSLRFTDVSDASLEMLANIDALNALDVTGTLVTASGVARFRERRPDVHLVSVIVLDEPMVAAARELSRRDWEVALQTPENSEIVPVWVTPPRGSVPPADEDLDLLNKFPRLAVTVSQACPSSMHEFLARSKQIEVIVSHGGLTDDHLLQFLALKRLGGLVVSNHTLTAQGFAHLRAMPSLTVLAIEPAYLSQSSFGHLGACTTLEFLSLSRGKFEDSNFSELATLTRLESLQLTYAVFSPGATRPLSACTKLRTLNFEKSNLNDELLAPICTLPKLVSINIGNSDVSDAGLAQLASVKSLRQIDCQAATNLTPAGIERFRKLRPEVVVNE